MVLATTLIGALDYLGAPNDYAVGDFNGDGKLDVLLTGVSWDFVENQPSDRGNAIFALMAQGDGTFSIEQRSDLGSLVTPIATDVADFNGDGIDDAVFFDFGLDRTPFSGGPNELVFGTDTGPVSADIPIFSDQSHGGTIGDVDNDGDVDIFVMNNVSEEFPLPGSGSPGAYILLNDGAGNFTFDQSGLSGDLPDPYFWAFEFGPYVRFNSLLNSSTWVSAEMGDMNNDGNIDLIVGSHYFNERFIAFGDGNGNFDMANAAPLPDTGFGRFIDENGGNVGGLTLALQVADINGDGVNDLVASAAAGPDYTGSYLQILINDGQGNLIDESATRFLDSTYNNPTGEYIADIAETDFNSDGFSDFILNSSFFKDSVTLNQGTRDQHPMVLLNDGTGRFDILKFGDLGLPSIALVAVDGGFVTFDNTTYGTSDQHYGLSNAYFVEGDYSTGPGGANPAALGAPGFNELYYLNNNSDVLAGVTDGSIESGLAHYLSSGIAEGRAGFAPGATVQG